MEQPESTKRPPVSSRHVTHEGELPAPSQTPVGQLEPAMSEGLAHVPDVQKSPVQTLLSAQSITLRHSTQSAPAPAVSQ